MSNAYDQAIILTSGAGFVLFAWGGAMLVWTSRLKPTASG
ncbi:hypothetical protein LF41_1138 [Lysobacter dokdonensis DS-58]|uniref:Uncharacterized protein n=1 Tax=Lysobacter dokdonensis DS-58 TaxID=1300345 RepID=A0A0A2WK82_9GAMM|nr:hypothetical protein LF41_1138 [Lysobacter dokdonensis DS-58]